MKWEFLLTTLIVSEVSSEMEYIVGIIILVVIVKLFSGKSETASSGRSSKTKYFQNRCYVCEHYADTQGHPSDSNDFIKCPKGGSVKVGVGCSYFKPDITASCDSCWYFKRGDITNSCDIHGKLLQFRQYCPDAIEKDSV